MGRIHDGLMEISVGQYHIALRSLSTGNYYAWFSFNFSAELLLLPRFENCPGKTLIMFSRVYSLHLSRSLSCSFCVVGVVVTQLPIHTTYLRKWAEGNC